MEGLDGRPPSRPLERHGGDATMAGRRLEPLSTQMPRVGYGIEHPMHSPYTPQPLSTPIQYQPEYQHEQSRQTGYPAYGPGMDYSMSQSPATPSYAQYPSRQNTMDGMPQGYGVQQYYEQSAPSTMPTPPPPPPHHPSHFTPVHYDPPGSATRLTHPYTPQSSVDPSAEHEYQQQQQQQQQQPQVSSMDEAYNQYLNVLRQSYMNIRDSKLSTAGEQLLTISNWLLSNAEELGLVRDDKNLHEDRVNLWNEFNMAWISCMRKQKEMLGEGLLPSEISLPRELLTTDFLRRMGTELVRLCDSLEKHGLVDYQFGVWEDEIIESIQECLDIMETPADSPPHTSSGHDASPVKSEAPIAASDRYEQLNTPQHAQNWPVSSASGLPGLSERA